MVVRNIRIRREDWSNQDSRTLEFDIFNYGKSPAWLHRHTVIARLGERDQMDLPGPPNYGQPEDIFGVVPPHGGVIHVAYSGDTLRTEPNEEALRDQGRTLFLYGFVSYRDQHLFGNGPIARFYRYRLRRSEEVHRSGYITRCSRDNAEIVNCGERPYWNYT